MPLKDEEEGKRSLLGVVVGGDNCVVDRGNGGGVNRSVGGKELGSGDISPRLVLSVLEVRLERRYDLYTTL